MALIAERDPGTTQRRIPGHWEGDLIIGKDGASCAATLEERMPRYTHILALPSKASDGLAGTLIEQANALPDMMLLAGHDDQRTNLEVKPCAAPGP